MPAQDGAGWLIRLLPIAPTMIMVATTLIILYSLYLILKPKTRTLLGEEKILVFFLVSMLLPPIAALIGLGAWFATMSIPVGCSAAISFMLGMTAMLLKE